MRQNSIRGRRGAGGNFVTSSKLFLELNYVSLASKGGFVVEDE